MFGTNLKLSPSSSCQVHKRPTQKCTYPNAAEITIASSTVESKISVFSEQGGQNLDAVALHSIPCLDGEVPQI